VPISDPTDIANCELYWDVHDPAFSDAGTTPCAVGDTIQQLTDLSGNSRHGTQATAGKRATFTTIEGVGAARHLGGHYWDSTSFLDSSYDTAFTEVLVHWHESASGFAVVSNDASANARHDLSCASNVETTQIFNGTLSDTTMNATLSRQAMRVEVVRYNGATKKIRIAGPDNDTASSESATNNLGLGATWRLGDYGVGGGFGYYGMTRALALYKRALTDGEVDDLVTWAIAKFMAHSNGSHSNGAGTINVVCDGNSITEGNGAAGGANSYPTQLGTLLGGGYAVTNKGTAGVYIGHMIDDRFRTLNTIDTLFDASAAQNILIACEGTNDIQNGASAVQSFQRMKEYCLIHKHKGWQIIVATTIADGNYNGTQETERAAYNALVVANWPDFADGLADFAADTHFDAQSDTSDTTYYQVDTIHLTATGNGILAQIAYDAIQALPSGATGSPWTYYAQMMAG